MALVSDQSQIASEFGTVMYERDPFTFTPVYNNAQEYIYGGNFMAAYLYFTGWAVSEGKVDGGLQNGWAIKIIGGRKVTKLTLRGLIQCGKNVNPGYAGQIYNLKMHIDPEKAWWGNVADKIAPKIIANIEAPNNPNPSYINIAPLWETGSDFAAAEQIINNGIVIRANIGSGSVEINKISMIRTSHLLVTWESVKPIVKNPAPGYIDPKAGGALTWEMDWDHTDVFGELEQKYAIVQTRPNASSEATETRTETSEHKHTIAPNTLTAGFEWRVQVETRDGETSDWTEWQSVVIVDVMSTPECVSPINQIVEGGGSQTFRWRHVISTGTVQTGYKLQYSLDRTSWTDIASGSGSADSASVDTAQLPSGRLYWRVQTANADGVYGNWSDPALLVLRAAPRVSAVTATGNTLPLVSWTTIGQYGYEVMIDDKTSGVHYGTVTSYQWQDVLADGQHAVKVRVTNEFGLTSEWATLAYTVTNAPTIDAPALVASVDNVVDIRLDWGAIDADFAIVYRDGEELTRTTLPGTMVDHTATGAHTYKVRCVLGDGNYVDSNEATASVTIRDAVIAIDGAWQWKRLAYGINGDLPTREMSTRPVYALQNYSGRVLPVAEMSIFVSRSHTLSHTLLTKAEADTILSMIGQIVVYKYTETMIRGLLSNVTATRDGFGEYALTLTVTEVDE
nr:MAG TPA: Fibronectin, heparin, FNIII, heparin binding.4A [Caudoviricetes sp.]